MPSFESDFAILGLLGELPETWTAPEIYLTELNLQKILDRIKTVCFCQPFPLHPSNT